MLAALEDARRHSPIDASRVYLIGLSNGGLGVTQLAASSGEKFRGLAWLSPVFDDRLLRDQSIPTRCRSARLLIHSGEDDDRVPWNYVCNCADILRASGLDVTLEGVPGADHFLLFSHRRQVIERLGRWVGE